ncbi:hypothetical protein [Mesorhizobium sp. M0909]|uniref:hypothetical protein n=1 Tax=Mesorhizobium sp. M0909 TaxID=2957024 RepID=UPI003337EE07
MIKRLVEPTSGQILTDAALTHLLTSALSCEPGIKHLALNNGNGNTINSAILI